VAHTHVPAKVVFVQAPLALVTRIGRLGTDLWQPKSWTSKSLQDDGTFGYRFDDPGDNRIPPIPDAAKFRMIYCSTEFTGAVCEIAVRELLAPSNRADPTRQPPTGVIDEDRCRTRAAGFTTLNPTLVFVDVAARPTSNALNEALLRRQLQSSIPTTRT
jgi:hypothetical protein